MRLTTKKMEEIVLGIVGEEGLPLLRELTKRDNTSEFDLANKTRKDIKIVRKMLYLLYNHLLVSFSRKKDQQKGWYIYYWTLLPENIRFNYLKGRDELLAKLKHRLEEEHKELFFVCENNCARLHFDQAIDFDFRCPECGKLISPDSSEEKIAELKKRIAETEEELRAAREKKRQKVFTLVKKKALFKKKKLKKRK